MGGRRCRAFSCRPTAGQVGADEGAVGADAGAEQQAAPGLGDPGRWGGTESVAGAGPGRAEAWREGA